ncbi:IS256 family transposase [Streptomyces brasiliensis]|uniref:Mutator family transposase n=1 Tax=Streptomyces brasiliensis TaxID=1954 RepID=A0A917ULK0_9ACTN|nr:IS256 family transposase [Streptomyces brasiliensis]
MTGERGTNADTALTRATFADALMSAEADALCNAEYGQVSDERVNHRNGYRPPGWDTRAGTVELAIPKLRTGSYFPHWLLERRRRAEQALISVVATAYLLGVSTRRVEKLAESLGVTQLSKSQVSAMAKHLDEQVAAFRNRPLDAGPYAFVWVDALTQKLREGGRIINVHALIAVGVNVDGHREILGLDVATAEDGAGWLAFLRSLIARGLGGVQLVVSDRPQMARSSGSWAMCGGQGANSKGAHAVRNSSASGPASPPLAAAASARTTPCTGGPCG